MTQFEITSKPQNELKNGVKCEYLEFKLYRK